MAGDGGAARLLSIEACRSMWILRSPTRPPKWMRMLRMLLGAVLLVGVVTAPRAVGGMGSVPGTGMVLGSKRSGFEVPCPSKCLCSQKDQDVRVDCTAQNLTSVPANLSANTTHLDLSENDIRELPGDAFSGLHRLRELRLLGNKLSRLPRQIFKNTRLLQQLVLTNNNFKKIPNKAIQNLRHLQKLTIDTNKIEKVPNDSFKNLHSLCSLWLEKNSLAEIPVPALNKAHNLERLTLAGNKIKKIPPFAFRNLSKLSVLVLEDNMIEHVSDQAFKGLTNLERLHLKKNNLRYLPGGLEVLTNLRELYLDDNQIEYLPSKSFRGNSKLTVLQLIGNPITDVGTTTFANLPLLEGITLSEVHHITEFPDLTGSGNLKTIRLDRWSIKAVPDEFCHHQFQLETFDLHSNRISVIPKMTTCTTLLTLNLGNNEITSLEGEPFRGLSKLQDLTLSNNYIDHIPASAFSGLSKLQYLDMAGNKIKTIHNQAFLPLLVLEDLNLGDNKITELPTEGLQHLQKLKTYGNPQLREFPPKEKFPKIKSLTLAYPYHCCDYLQAIDESTAPKIALHEDIVWLGPKDENMGMWQTYENFTRIWDTYVENDTMSSSLANELYNNFGTQDYNMGDFSLPPEAENYLDDYKPRSDAQDLLIAKPPIICKPKPGPFMPCDDLFGWWSLRCGVWFVFMLALLGNGVVLFVSVTSRSKMDVPRFLICNLACADFFMGVYLGFLAIVDASTLGEFKKHAIRWQLSPGCLVAGFLGVLSSELSVFTLTVITMERFYAITHAMQLNKRLSLRHASYVMLCGWTFAFAVASLPLFSISDYRKFAVCLPFEIGDPLSKAYVCFIMIFNGISFFTILACYLLMYLSIRDSQAWNTNDTRVAKRMALLVFTDFVCWAPIAFLSLAAAFGKNLVHLNEAKVLTIFILPLNSCANPFLYAIFTKQFKKDCVNLCRRLEDSSIARHFSRVSNRQLSFTGWRSSRHPSGLHSLVPRDKRGSCSNSMSAASGGVLNYNSDLHSSRGKGERGGNSDADYDSCLKPQGKGKGTGGHQGGGNGGKSKSRSGKTHQSTGSGSKKKGKKHIINAQVTVHGEMPTKDKATDDMNYTTESYLTNDCDEDLKQALAEKEHCGLEGCPCQTVDVLWEKRDGSAVPVVFIRGQAPPVTAITPASSMSSTMPAHERTSRRSQWSHPLPCCSASSSPVEPSKAYDYEIHSVVTHQGEKPLTSQDKERKPKNSNSHQHHHHHHHVATVEEKGSNPGKKDKERERTSDNEDDEQDDDDLSSRRKKRGRGDGGTTRRWAEEEAGGDEERSLRRKSEDRSRTSYHLDRFKIDKRANMQYFTRSLAENDFMQPAVCRSNSLVELTQHQLVELYGPGASKRFSLTPHQEGYILLTGQNRDSAYMEDEEDELEFSPRALLQGNASDDDCCESGGSSQSRKFSKGPASKRYNGGDRYDEREMTTLLGGKESGMEDSIGMDSAKTCAVDSLNVPSNKNYDMESGFVSEN